MIGVYLGLYIGGIFAWAFAAGWLGAFKRDHYNSTALCKALAWPAMLPMLLVLMVGWCGEEHANRRKARKP